MNNLGKINTLKVARFAAPGAYLNFNDSEVLLPNKYVPSGCKIDDEVQVFIYKDSEDRLVATTLRPKAQVGEFAAMEVVDVAPFGAFLDWGLEKHLLVPKREMQAEMQLGNTYVVKVVVDHLTNRILGVAKLGAFIYDDASYENGAEVSAWVVSTTELGYKLLVDDKYWGMLYKNEVFEPVKQGDLVHCFVRKVRDDGKIDLALRKPGRETQLSDASKVLDVLYQNNGKMEVSDKSSPEVIKQKFGLSKKAFKKAIGALYKERKILILDSYISLSK